MNAKQKVTPVVDAGLYLNFFTGKLSFRNNDCNDLLSFNSPPTGYI